MTRNPLKLLTLVAALAASGCAPDTATLQVVGICGMTTDCTFSSTCDAYYTGTVGYNSSLGSRLFLMLEVNNQLPDNSDKTTSRVNTNDAHVTGYRLEFTSGGPGNITVNAGNSPVPAAGTSLVAVYAAPAGAPAGRYQVNVYLIGYYDNGREFETPAFPIGLEVGAYAFGCPAGEVDACPGTGAQSVYQCAAP